MRSSMTNRCCCSTWRASWLLQANLVRPGVTIVERLVPTTRECAHEETYRQLTSVLTRTLCPPNHDSRLNIAECEIGHTGNSVPKSTLPPAGERVTAARRDRPVSAVEDPAERRTGCHHGRSRPRWLPSSRTALRIPCTGVRCQRSRMRHRRVAAPLHLSRESPHGGQATRLVDGRQPCATRDAVPPEGCYTRPAQEESRDHTTLRVAYALPLPEP